MRKIITNQSTRYYYEKGDKLVQVSTGKEFVFDKVSEDKKILISNDGEEFELSTDIRPTLETKMKSKLVDKSRNIKREVELPKLYFARVKPDAIIPTKRDEDACFDLYANFITDELVIPSLEIRSVPTGIATAFDKRYKATVYERGSSGSRGLSKKCGIIDSGYRGEWIVVINNTTNKTIIITKKYDAVVETETKIFYPYTKAIAQFAMEKVPKMKEEIVDYETLLAMASERGTGKLGSSNK